MNGIDLIDWNLAALSECDPIIELTIASYATIIDIHSFIHHNKILTEL